MKKIFDSAQDCRRCYSNKNIKVPYFELRNGSRNVKIMFINERPGRVGPGESDIVSQYNEDPSAKTFKHLLDYANIKDKDIFITNSCLCYLPNIPVNKQHPKIKELKNCHYWLEKQIEITNPKLIVTIGRCALESLKRMKRFEKSKKLKAFNSLKENIGSVIDDTDIKIYPLYHTSKRGQISRKLEKQEKDWLKINKFIKKL